MGLKNVAVIGGAGYVGIELVRHVLGHPHLNLVAVTSDKEAGKPLASLYPALTSKTDMVFSAHSALDSIPNIDAVFLAAPHKVAMTLVPSLLLRGISVFDISADFRLKDPEVYQQWYGEQHTAPGLLSSAIYGLPEINRSLLLQGCADRITNASPLMSPILIACPGCYPTASILATAPALVIDAWDGNSPIIINALSGVSGAGRVANQTTHFCSVDQNVNAYGVTTHRHTPEIAQALSWQAGQDVPVVFTPHLIPMKRGLLSTVTLQIKPHITAEALLNAYKNVYDHEPFVQVLPYGTMPRTSSVIMTNNAQIGLKLNTQTNTLIASCAIDNLGKGAASQAIQCANIIFNFEETAGLTAIPGVL